MNSLEELADGVHDILIRHAEPEGGAARARVTRAVDADRMPWFTLEPYSVDACRAIVRIDGMNQLGLELGRYGTPIEVFSKAGDELLRLLSAWVEGVVEGRYSERVRLDRAGQLARAKGSLTSKQGDRVDGVHAFEPAAGRLGPWIDIHYRPYEPGSGLSQTLPSAPRH